VMVDYKKHKVSLEGEDIHLTPIEWRLLGELMANAGRFVSYDDLLSRVWGPEYRGSLELLHSWMSRLRRKIERDPANKGVIRTIFKSGYIIEKPGLAGETPPAT
jgi:DNA-binding response OmpR family regulator